MKYVMQKTFFSLGLALASTSLASPASAQTTLSSVESCRLIASPIERLACYDRAFPIVSADSPTAPILNDETTRPVENSPSKPVSAPIYAPTVKENDLTAPIKSAQSKAEIEAEEVEAINVPILRIDEFGYKKRRFVLKNGQIWDQISPGYVRLPRSVESGTAIAEIRTAALNSYTLQIDGEGRAIKVKRRR